ncbi:MAG: SM-20-related protein [Chthoniobacter sp.]|jgi:SM-20-related protein|nr:SM-20-related protein [Chthoniobacter sp.]
MIDLLELGDFLDALTREELRAELGAAAGRAATVLGRHAQGSIEARVRKVTRLTVSAESCERIRWQLLSRKSEIEEHFGIPLTECEVPQFLRYETGDFFVAHQDGNTPLVFDDSRFRKISIVIFLSTPSAVPAPDTYGGGSLVFHGPYSGPTLRVPVTPAPGTLIAFRAETTHEVTPVTHGERYSIVSWFR